MKFFAKNKNLNLKILEKINEKALTKRLISFVLGSLIVATSYNLFLAPNNLVAGGVGGIAIILRSLFGFESSITILVCNIILLIFFFDLL